MTDRDNRISKLSPKVYLSIILFLTMHTSLIWGKPLENNEINTKGSTSLLASKVIFESPVLTLEKALTQFVVTSKPLNLRKKEPGQKRKRPKKDSKKDSKIYVIPVPPAPYRYIPGVGYDYQPMKINPIMLEAPTTKPAGIQKFQEILKNLEGLSNQYLPPIMTTKSPITKKKRKNMKDSKIIRIQYPSKNYFFNGRPLNLKVAHAEPRTTNLTKHTLESNFYFNKNLIY